jgi:hypothetical protein
MGELDFNIQEDLSEIERLDGESAKAVKREFSDFDADEFFRKAKRFISSFKELCGVSEQNVDYLRRSMKRACSYMRRVRESLQTARSEMGGDVNPARCVDFGEVDWGVSTCFEKAANMAEESYEIIDDMKDNVKIKSAHDSSIEEESKKFREKATELLNGMKSLEKKLRKINNNL